MKRIIYLVLFIIFSCGSGSKDSNIKNQIKLNIEEFKKTGYSFYQKGNIENAINYFKRGIELAYSVDSTYQIIELYCLLGDIYLSIGDLNNASNAIFSAEKIEKFENVNLFSVSLGIAKYYSKLYEKTKNEEYLNKSQSYFEFAKNKIHTDDEKASYYNNYAKLMLRTTNYSEALNNFEKALSINEAKKNYFGMADNYYNLGKLYEAKKEYEKALEYYKKALKYDKIVENSDGIYLDNKKIGIIYKIIGEKEKSIYYFEKSKKIAESINNKNYIEEIEKLLKE